MCHRISWYHALCLHPDQTSTVRISCKSTLHWGYDCGTIETWSLPMLGVCPLCTVKAAFAENLPQKSQSYAMFPIREGSDDGTFKDNDETYFSYTHSEDSIDELELFDRITF